MPIDDATRAQIEAARPDASTWLAANAGSGKTRVLTDRVARLLLQGVAPQQILCLTYTKAAASEMQNRLFRRLGEWAMLRDAPLREALAMLGIEGDLPPEDLRSARTLFALAIEAPGGLKIQTIHSFCASLLRRFPLEAGVSPQFTEIEDRAAELLRAEIVDDMAEGTDAPLVADLAAFYTGDALGKLTGRIVNMRTKFRSVPDRARVLRALGQPADLDHAELERDVFDGTEDGLFDRIVPHLLTKGGNDAKAGALLAAISGCDIGALPVLEQVFLTGAKAQSPFTAKIGAFPTKATQAVIACDMPALEAFMQRVEDARELRLALGAADRTIALHRFGATFLARYEDAKSARGWLDFDDLILKARALLTDPAVAAWVLYRIDGGIDHILVDEAQDTAPSQWEVIERLTGEFFSGSGSRPGVDRTLFVVGDKKQSIYSFQGADPREFDTKSQSFKNRITDAGKAFQERSLNYSFRSSNAILRFVDTAFDPRIQPGLDKPTVHRAFKELMPGRVDIWPLVEEAETEPDGPWTDPVDRRSAHHHTVILANRIADRIAELTRGDHFIPDDEDGRTFRRRIRPGDFLILVQRRSALFAEIIRACKVKGLPIAGADRLKVGAELAVKDIAALLSFLATPEDSLSLATALKSPLFGWSEKALFQIAHDRGAASLWQVLRVRTDIHGATVAMLRDLRAQVDYLRPYDLIERVLTRHDGRRRLLSRLGAEAEDGINAILTQALSYERTTVPSLTGFIEWMQTDDLEIKRQIDSASNQIRVMTVHGAKGLEAPIVILPDSGRRDIAIKDEIVVTGGLPIWKPPSDALPAALRETVESMKTAEFEERLRLFYVAMTRAEKWLIVAAAGKLPDDQSAWYQIARRALSHINAVPVDPDGTLRFAEGDWDALPVSEAPVSETATPELEPEFTRPAPIFAHAPLTLSPSDLGGAKALPGELGEDRDTAKSYGTLVHRLLEVLADVPAEQREARAAPILLEVPVDQAGQALEEVMGVLDLPALSAIFQPDTLAEIPITGQIGGQRLHGLIDRLIVGSGSVRVVDYKTNRMVPPGAEACPEGLLRQMGAYAALLAPFYPDHRVDTAILWTATGRLMELPHELVTAALWRSPYLDAKAGRS